jgi:hypothetical protein
MTKIEEIIKLTGEEIKFDTPVSVKPRPHTPIIGIEEIATHEDRVWLRTYKGSWFQLEETDRNFEIVANSVLQRLRLLKKEIA